MCCTRDTAISQIANYLLNEKVTRVVALTGAGLSTASGIPDFRSPGSGLYDNLAKYNLPWPEAVFDLDYFVSNPVPFYTLAKELYPSGRYRPNIGHYFLRLLHEKRRLLRVYTQNIDNLERMAGIPLTKVVEAHGTFTTASCIGCSSKASPSRVREAIETGVIPKCKKCGGLVKPDVVFFGENMPDRFWTYPTDLERADLVLILGTSLEVYPFAALAEGSPEGSPRVLFNREVVGSLRDRPRALDIIILGDISQSISQLSKQLKWDSELDDLMKDGESAQIHHKKQTRFPRSHYDSTHTTSNNNSGMKFQRDYSTSVNVLASRMATSLVITPTIRYMATDTRSKPEAKCSHNLDV